MSLSSPGFDRAVAIQRLKGPNLKLVPQAAPAPAQAGQDAGDTKTATPEGPTGCCVIL
jgi:hypothetical protein